MDIFAKLTLLFVSVSLCVFCTADITGQTKHNAIIVTVRDQFGGVVANALVTLSDSEAKKSQFTTNENGVARFAGLESKEYVIAVSAAGFLEHKSESIKMRSGGIEKIDVSLDILPVESKVEVDGSDSVQPDDYGMVTLLTFEDIQKMPDDPVEFYKALRRIAGESITGGDLPINVNGIDGEPIPPKQFIEQIRIDRNAFSAKYAGMGGGGIQISTSSNTKTFKGFFNFNFADSRLNAKEPFLGRRAPYRSLFYRFGLSGPLGRKTSFSLSASRNRRDSSSVINAVVLDSNLQPSEYRTAFLIPNQTHIFNLSINSDPFKKHKTYLNYTLNQSRSIMNSGGFSLPERATADSRQAHSLSFLETYLVSEKIVSRTRLTLRHDFNKISGVTDSPAINVAESFSAGGSPLDNLNSNSYFDISNDVTHQRGKMSWEYGFSIRSLRIAQNSRSNFNGTYSFNGRIAPILDSNNQPLTDSNGNIVTQQISSLESYRRTILYQRLGFTAEQIRDLGGGADQFSISGGKTEISATQFEYDLYMQGSYNLRRNLGVSLGLRYENQNNISSPLNFAPRFSLIWSPKEKSKKRLLLSLPRISVGVGVNYSRFALNNTVINRQINDENRFFYFASVNNLADSSLNSLILNSFPLAPTIESLEKKSLPRSRRIIRDDIQTPYDLVSNLTLNKKISAKLIAVFSFSHALSFRRQLTANINAPLGGTFSFYNPSDAVYPFGKAENISEINSQGKAESLKISANLLFSQIKFLNKSVSLNLRYNFGKSRDNIAFGSGSPFDAYDFSQEYAPAFNDGTHVINGNASYELPLGFGIGGSWAIRSGTKFNITTGRDSNGDGLYSERPAFASDRTKPGTVNTIYGLLDPNPVPGDKIIPRNLGRGPGSMDFDAYLSRSFRLNAAKNSRQSSRSLSFTILCANVFNINNKGNPVGNMSSPRFVRILSGAVEGGNDDLISRSNPRNLNLSVNFNF